jgi:hypothetical protein
MMSDVIERFRYRFQLWRRERREDYTLDLSNLGDYETPASPEMQALRKSESTLTFFVRSIGLYFGVLLLLSALAQFIIRLVPSTRPVIIILFLGSVFVWTLFMIFGSVREYSIRKRLRADSANHLTKRSSQPRTD